MKSGQSAFFGRLDPALWNHETGLKIIVAIKQNQQLPVPKETEQLLWITFAFRNTDPNGVDPHTELRSACGLRNTHPRRVGRHTEFRNLESRALVRDRLTPVGADDEISINVTL